MIHQRTHDLEIPRALLAADLHDAERFRALVTASSDVIYCMSPDWRELRYLNGRNFVADTRESDPHWLERYVPEEDRESVLNEIARSTGTKSFFELEHRVHLLDGSIGWTFSRAIPILDEAGGIVEWFGAARNITRRKLAEKTLEKAKNEAEAQRRLYEAILTNTPDLAYVFDLNHRFIYANEGLLRMWGRTWDDAIGKTCLELGYEPWHAAMHDREIEQVVRTREAIRGEVPFTGTFGRRYYDYIFVPVLDPYGNVAAVAGTTRDVTERRHMEDRVREQAERLAESDRRKDEFLRILAHELRNPLAPLKNSLELLRLKPDDPQNVARSRDVMHRQLNQMIRLLDDLLDISRISSGKISVRKTQADLGAIIQQAIEASNPFIQESGHELTVALPDHPLFVSGDCIRLAQVFSSVLSNAAKFTPRGGSIRISAERIDGCALVKVQDSGAGIPAGMLEKVFEMFEQVDRSLEREQGGLGIGLYLAKGLVELHDGSITARSDGSGKGSEFEIRLPLAEEIRDPVAAVSQPAHETTRAQKILVADDNVDAARSFSMILQMLGHEVLIAHDGVEAIAAAESGKPDVIFLDIGMPRLNGFAACERIRRLAGNESIKIVALTGWGQESDRKRSQEAGFTEHLTKPVDLMDIQRVLKSA